MSNSRRGLTARQPLGRRRGRADLNHLRAMTDAEIRRTTLQSSRTCLGFLEGAELERPAAPRRQRRKQDVEVRRPPPSTAGELGGPNGEEVRRAGVDYFS